jgi:alpha-ribazole phosphatase
LSHIFLVRHGEVEGNSIAAGGRLTFAGWGDKPLTQRGELQAKAVAARLSSENLSAIYASDLMRAQDTARELAQRHDLDVRTDKRLREVNYGAWEGLGLDEILAAWPDVWDARNRDPENIAPPQGESYADLWRRVEPAWNEIVRSHGEDERIAIVAHNGTLRILLCHLLGMPFAHFKRIQTSNCGISHLEVKRAIEYSNAEALGAEKFSMVAHNINETNHLKEI